MVINKQDMLKIEDISSSTFLQWHRWCKTVRQGYLAQGLAGILGIFYFEIVPASTAVDDTLWVIVGDVPPAYIDCLNSPNAVSALEDYLYSMQQWVDHVREGQSVDELIPVYRRHSFVRVDPSSEYSELLGIRLQFIRENIVPDTIVAPRYYPDR